MIRFNAILRDNGFPVETTWLARHQDKRMKSGWSPYKLWRHRPDEFMDYQSTQAPDKFKDGTHLASFPVDSDGNCIFAGIYKILGSEPARQTVPWLALDYCDVSKDIRYTLQHDPTLSELEGRLIIDWGPAALTWAQRAANQDKTVLEVLKLEAGQAWPGYDEVLIMDYELKQLPQDWIVRLSAVTGVYLLTCSQSGAQYIGSATGETGFYGRWQSYADGGHGGNIRLRDHRRETDAPIVISILELFGSRLSPAEALAKESLWKQKLGTRAHSLNAN